jgi:hypothetical protein
VFWRLEPGVYDILFGKYERTFSFGYKLREENRDAGGSTGRLLLGLGLLLNTPILYTV